VTSFDDEATAPPLSAQSRVNAQEWEYGNHVQIYANRELTPAEVILLVRYREKFAGRVLDVGCGGGRVLGFLVELGGDVHGVDLSPAMVAYCQRLYPRASVRVGDMAELGRTESVPYDAVFAGANIIDVFDDGERRRVLSELRRIVADDGILVFSTHNLAWLDGHPDAISHESADGAADSRGRAAALASRLVGRPPADVIRLARRIPRRFRNRRRLASMERRTADYAIVNDEALDYALLHYYIRRDDQARQLKEEGYELLECLDADGRRVAPGEVGRGASLHYVARPT
jgi:SAM-dependent methyltransferase